MYYQTVECELECFVSIEAKGQLTDYGVPGSPVWTEYEPVDFADLTVDIAGVTVKLSELPEELRNAILESAYENIDDDKWESE